MKNPGHGVEESQRNTGTLPLTRNGKPGALALQVAIEGNGTTIGFEYVSAKLTWRQTLESDGTWLKLKSALVQEGPDDRHAQEVFGTEWSLGPADGRHAA
jgi:hypothetical protein